MKRPADSIDPWLDLLPSKPRPGASERVAARVAAAIALERRPWWRSWPLVGVSAAAAGILAVFLLTNHDVTNPPVVTHSDAEVAALADLSETLSVIATVQADYFGTD